MKKRGQLTIFIILGIFLVIIFSLAFFIRSMIIQEGNPNIDTQIDSFTKSIKTQVTECLFLVTQEALIRAGEQGGDLYDLDCSQTPCAWRVRTIESVPTTAPSSGIFGVDYLKFYDEKYYAVSYGIKRNNDTIPPAYNYDDSNYPSPNFNFNSDIARAVSTGTEYFGDNVLRALCDGDGPNKIDPKQKIGISCSPKSYDFFYFGELKTFSIQEQLARYVKEHLPTCVNLSSYSMKGMNFDIGEPNVTIIFGENDVTSTVDYPLIFSSSAFKSRGRAIQFSTNVNIRIKKVYEYIFNIIQKDIVDLNFYLNDSDDYKDKTLGWEDQFVITRKDDKREVCTSCTYPAVPDQMDLNLINLCLPGDCTAEYDDIIQVNDTSTNYVFNFAVQNRRPVLNVHKKSYSWSHPPTESDCGLEHLNQYLDPLFKAIDPDDEKLFFSAQNWRHSDQFISSNIWAADVYNTVAEGSGSIEVMVKDNDPNSLDKMSVQYECEVAQPLQVP